MSPGADAWFVRGWFNAGNEEDIKETGTSAIAFEGAYGFSIYDTYV